MGCEGSKEHLDGDSSVHTMPPTAGTSPSKALKRFRLSNTGKKLYDLEKATEKLEGKQREIEKDQSQFRKKIKEYEDKLAESVAKHDKNCDKMTNLNEEIRSISQVDVTDEGTGSPMEIGTGAPEHEDLSEMYLDVDSDDEGNAVWDEAHAANPHHFSQDFLFSPQSDLKKMTRVESCLSELSEHDDDEPRCSDEELSRLLKPGTSVLHPRTWKPLPEQEAPGHCWTRKMETDLFDGEAALYMRDKDPAENGVFQSQIWEGKNRVFTFQVQGKFKRKPVGPVCFYLSALDDYTTLGMISKRLGKMWLAFARNWEEKLDINFKNAPGKPLALIAPISCTETGWMGIWETKLGDEPWKLGNRLPPHKECLKHNGRDGRGLVDLENPDFDATYTLEFYTANLDLFRWVLTSIPVLPEINLNRFAPEYQGVKNSSGFFACLREMGPEDEKFLRESPNASICTQAHIMRREKKS